MSSELYAGDYDLSLNYTYGVPYEPHITIRVFSPAGLMTRYGRDGLQTCD